MGRVNSGVPVVLTDDTNADFESNRRVGFGSPRYTQQNNVRRTLGERRQITQITFPECYNRQFPKRS